MRVKNILSNNVLAFFANSEAMINENLASRFYKEILMPEARCFISMQMLKRINTCRNVCSSN